MQLTEDIQILENLPSESEIIINKESALFTAELERSFRILIEKLLDKRLEVENEMVNGNFPGFLDNTKSIRNNDWPIKKQSSKFDNKARDLELISLSIYSDQWLGIKNRVVILDFSGLQIPEIVLSLSKLEILLKNNNHILFKPRELDLKENNFLVDEQIINAAVFDSGFYLFKYHQQNCYFYLSDIQNHYEARFWSDLFQSAQDSLNSDNISVCININNINTLFQIEEIIYELSDYVFAIHLDKEFFTANEDYLLTIDNSQINFAEFIDYISKKRNILAL